MSNYSKEELQYIATQVQPYLLELVKALGLDVDSIEVVEEYDGISSLPAYDNRGGTKKLVRVPLSAFAKPAIDAVAEIEELIAKAEETISKSEEALGNTESALEEIYQIRDELRAALDEAQQSIQDLESRIVQVESSETQRIVNENTRVSNENERNTAEAVRENAEDVRISNETQRKSTFESWATTEAEHEDNEAIRKANEEVRISNEDIRKSSENVRVSAEKEREQAKANIMALNEELKTHPPRINDKNNWEIWDAVNKVYIDTGTTAQGKSPIIVDGTWWLWNDDIDEFVDSHWAVNADFQLTREAVESSLGGTPAFYVEEWNHLNAPFRSGSVVKFNQEFYSALRDTDIAPVPLLLLGEGIIAKVDEHTYATTGSYDAEGNKEDWRKIPLDELRLSSRYGLFNGEEVDVRDLATAEEVYQLEPNLYIDLLRGILKAKKVDFPNLPVKNVTDALGYVPASTAQHEALTSEVTKQGVRLDSLENNALVSTYTLEQSSNPAFEVSNKNAANLYISQMGGYLFYNGNADGKVYAAKLNPYDWGKFADGTPVTEAIEAATETMVHVPDCHFKASGKTMNFGGIIPIDGGHTFGSPHWVGAYQGYIADGALHSRPNVAPSHSNTMSAFWSYAQATHANKQYGLANYQFHCLINALYQARYGDLNSQVTIGAGWQHSSREAVRDVSMGLLRALGDGTGKVLYNDVTLGDQYPVKLFGFEDLWGKMWEFRPNIRFEMRDGVRYAIVYDGNQVSNTAEGREFVGGLTGLEGEYIKTMKLGEYWDMIPEMAGSSEITYYCDTYWAAFTGESLLVSAPPSAMLGSGISNSSSGPTFTDSRYDFGARLAYWGEPEIIGGAELAAMINS